MAAEEHLGSQFFHGTRATFRVGRTVDPVKNPMYHDTHFYMTDNADVADDYAFHAPQKGHQKVYQVEPTGEVQHDPEAWGYNSFKTPHKVRVLKRVM